MGRKRWLECLLAPRMAAASEMAMLRVRHELWDLLPAVSQMQAVRGYASLQAVGRGVSHDGAPLQSMTPQLFSFGTQCPALHILPSFTV